MIGWLNAVSSTLRFNETHANELSFTACQVTMLIFVGINNNGRCELPALPKTECFMQTPEERNPMLPSKHDTTKRFVS
jgi:hypothetical protein